MRPRLLKINGLNSFEKEQEIDFYKLTEKGLFGIFGPTGSGKSTILDGITIALYGKVTRANKGYINTNTKSLAVTYEFEINVGGQKKVYIVEREIKINKNGGYNTKYARLIERLEKEETVIAEGPNEIEKQIEKIIGLTAEDFTRSVVLPQGKFSEFLKISGKERRNMLERIFSLEKYGKKLVDRIRLVRNKYIKEQNILTGELKKYEDITEEEFKRKEIQLIDMLKEEEILKNQKKKLDKDYEKYKNIWELQKELDYFNELKYQLEKNLLKVKVEKQKLKKAENALKVKPCIDEVIKIKEDLDKNKIQLQNSISQMLKIESDLKKIEECYEDVSKEKEDTIPILIKKEASLNEAIVIYNKIYTLELERDELRQVYSDLNNKKLKLDNKLYLLYNDKEKLVKEINKIDKKLIELKIEPEYKEKVQTALEKENEYNKCVNRKKELEIKIKERKGHLDKLKKEYVSILETQKAKHFIVKRLEDKLKSIKDSNPGDHNLIFEKVEKINSYKEKIDKFNSYYDRLNIIEENLNKSEENKNSIEKKLSEANTILSKQKSIYNELLEDIETINKTNLANVLALELKEGKPCPVCGSIHHISPASKIDDSILREKEEKKLNLESYIEKLNKNLNEISLELATVTKEIHNMNEEHTDIKDNIKEFDIKNLKHKKDREEKQLLILKSNIEGYTKSKESIEKQLNFERDIKGKIDIEQVKFKESIKNEENILKDLNEEILRENVKLEEISKEYIPLKKELALDSISSKLEEIKKSERQIRQFENTQRHIRDDLDKIIKDNDFLIKKQGNLDVDIGKILQSGKEKSMIIEREKKELERLSENKDPHKYLVKVKEKIKDIVKRADEIKLKLQEFKNKKQIIGDKKLALEEGKNLFLARLEEENKKLLILMKENEFKSEDEVLDVLMEEEEIVKTQKYINDFEDKLKNANNNIDRIENKLKGEYIEEQEWENLKNSREENEKLLNLKIKQIATTEKIIDDLKQSIKELKILRKKEKEINHKLSLLNDIGKLVEGNKFVEYVATSQLRYISREASRRLKSITRDRYALEIDSDGNFIIRDDFNGGEIRDTSTLSGGETFLASLSLALALSSQVQLKGSSPLEFFFLDEGFGTLDTELLDIVMYSLERLRSSKLSIGIISHVEELKNRVPIKLMVIPARQGEGGSKVRLEYT